MKTFRLNFKYSASITSQGFVALFATDMVVAVVLLAEVPAARAAMLQLLLGTRFAKAALFTALKVAQ